MSFTFGFRLLGILAGSFALTACQSLFPDEDNTSIGALRLSQAEAVQSRQRLDEDGYPLLGAYPGTAAPQLTDAAVDKAQGEFTSIARTRAAAPRNAGYEANIAASMEARRRLAEAGRAASATQPAASGTAKRGPRPEDVLRQIEATEQPTN
ncbi:hypothetical protein U0C82_13030 [Fulvimarina sp. 2208YS6-2-32]|uniref:DUF4398 domain-containing protein n=1 Tax=Fulvimarina uroteuthidis TaxID=3098149 RepID=A0ABU5I5H9_9HYPH|nr:hypothetical protein [Fulvimarina sp. 2208YS6-2-32]MDY8110064.1 hypothetical protein [Fulvimarina sp. 2208YS6-2-32]